MYNILIRLMVIAALSKFGISLFDFENCNYTQCLKTIETKSREVLSISWKPISVFPEEARRFR